MQLRDIPRCHPPVDRRQRRAEGIRAGLAQRDAAGIVHPLLDHGMGLQFRRVRKQLPLVDVAPLRRPQDPGQVAHQARQRGAVRQAASLGRLHERAQMIETAIAVRLVTDMDEARAHFAAMRRIGRELEAQVAHGARWTEAEPEHAVERGAVVRDDPADREREMV